MEAIEKSGYMDILLDGRNDQIQLAHKSTSGPSAIALVNTLCDIFCNNPSYRSILRSVEDSSFWLDSGMYCARAVSIDIIEFLCPKKYRWKVQCFRCLPSQSDPIWMSRNIAHHHLIHTCSITKNRQIIMNWMPQNRGIFRSVSVFCDECNNEIHDFDYTFRCSPCIHDICLCCFKKKFEAHRNITKLLSQCLRNTLNDDLNRHDICFFFKQFSNNPLAGILFSFSEHGFSFVVLIPIHFCNKRLFEYKNLLLISFKEPNNEIFNQMYIFADLSKTVQRI
ncbi:hypothetical protein RFI_27131 [Reticulomyxa filosa]|uniref:Uncharacterized protein n=1 Tax=Reticulomyxa filosa TaxID=46433 RepID=X6M9T9_RETFI|nr:hypothetical protein RFI_27131 [Reticulomyxa filosa]|eukprot:ETO10247.1 hypothetical protein RFI_27131 [Reticulomyxa filosa]